MSQVDIATLSNKHLEPWTNSYRSTLFGLTFKASDCLEDIQTNQANKANEASQSSNHPLLPRFQLHLHILVNVYHKTGIIVHTIYIYIQSIIDIAPNHPTTSTHRPPPDLQVIGCKAIQLDLPQVMPHTTYPWHTRRGGRATHFPIGSMGVVYIYLHLDVSTVNGRITIKSIITNHISSYIPYK